MSASKPAKLKMASAYGVIKQADGTFKHLGSSLGFARPFIKMAGGKTQLLTELLKHVPEKFGTYHEPFLGGGALFWWLAASGRIRDSVISDTSEVLIKSYRAVRDHVDTLVEKLSVLANDPVVFQRMRERDPREMDDLETAVWFIYLNKTAFNGLWRVNKQGKYNVPFGDYPKPKICDEPNLRACSAILNAEIALPGVKPFGAHRILCQSFEDVLLIAKQGDLVFCDPPYPPLSKTANFVSYTDQGFPWSKQEELRDVLLELKMRGTYVIHTNSDQPRVRELYADPRFTIHSVGAIRAINSKGSGRGQVGELVIT